MFYRFVRAIVYPFVRLFYRIRCTGRENIPKSGGFVLCANHTSIVDVFVLAVAFHRTIHFMGKEELFKNRFTRFFFESLGSFAVKRGAGDIGAIEQACDYINQGEIFGIFPEGTRGFGNKPGKAKAGAALIAKKTGALVLPVAIKYSTGRARLFCKTQIHIGQPLDLSADCPPEESQRAEIRRTSGLIMDKITNLWEAVS